MVSKGLFPSIMDTLNLPQVVRKQCYWPVILVVNRNCASFSTTLSQQKWHNLYLLVLLTVFSISREYICDVPLDLARFSHASCGVQNAKLSTHDWFWCYLLRAKITYDCHSAATCTLQMLISGIFLAVSVCAHPLNSLAQTCHSPTWIGYLRANFTLHSSS